MEEARRMIAQEGLSERINLYLCNAKDIGRLPDLDTPYDLAIFRGSLIHFTPQVLEETLASLVARMRRGGTVIISESLYKGMTHPVFNWQGRFREDLIDHT
jgi:predicted O-methyltransferase YrrM